MTDDTEISQSAAAREPHRAGPAAGTSLHGLKFAGGREFQVELRRRIDEYFRQTGRRRRDSIQLYVKAAAILVAFVTFYVLLVFLAGTWWQAVPFAVLLGLATSGIGFNIMHDGGHGAFSRYHLINRIMARSLDLIGGSSYIWHWKHGIFHHTYANITGQDTDIALGKLARLTPHQPLHAHQRWQHWFIWPLYGVMAIKWHFYDDFRDLLMGRIGPHRIPRPRNKELAIFIGGKATFFSLAFGIPLIFHPWWVVALYYALFTFVVGMVLSVVFQLAHCVGEAAFHMPDESTGRMENAWAVHQVLTTVNFCRSNRVAAWLLGGLNYQIEHHLFPQICHSNYPAISALVKDTCRDFGIRYYEHPTFWAGILSHFRWLRRMGMPGTIA
ncbi:MAG: fatty acid desaturase [SAR324 cluster bacterium]|nr:fatty acid desaturase [SAR324 cluster bacterium]